jgi:peptidoglycan/xylan/chitin deacetylase (PgdA/CDA1 family)
MGLYQRLIRRDVVGLCYHTVSSGRPAHAIHLGPHKTPDQFEADLRWLKQHYEVIGYDELCERRAESGEQRAESRERRAGRPAILVTFDDGLREHLTVVAPLLKQHGIPAVFFITTALLDNRSMFYRHKVSLCLEAAQGRTGAELREILRQLAESGKQRAENGEQKAESCHPITSGSPLSALRSLLSSLTIFDEPLIDRACELLGVDWRRYLVEHRPYLTGDEIPSLAAAGFTIGAHGVTHARLTDVPSEKQGTDSATLPLCHSATLSACRTPNTEHRTLTSELVHSCRTIAALTGRASVPFAFPFSGDGICRNELRAIREQHPEVGLLFDRRGFRPDGAFIVHRVIADEPPETNESNLENLLRREYERQARATL